MKRIIFTFTQDDGVLFDLKFEGQVHESQFEVAGRELVTIARILREHRLAKQLQVRVEAKPQQQTGSGSDGQAPTASGPKE